ncbi:MAG: D-alanyl-D-alanine carboxypeptidase [Candidatus Yanofskybacteria bacterium]|nr:D-alanyl-D-alanine carboxypeptidase [Candidatus Yanofskybacteria bacterium]
MQSKLYILAISLAGLVIVNLVFVMDSSQKNNFANAEPAFNSSQAYLLPVSEPSYFPIYDSKIEKPVIDAKSGLVYDTRSGRTLFIKNSHLKLSIASLTKILSAIVVLENLDTKETVVIPKEALKVDEEKQGLYLNEEITVQNLLKLMLIESSNDAAYALAWHANNKGMNFVDKMNEKAQLLNMNDSKLLDPAGLNDEAYSTADDLVKLVTYSFKYDLIWEILTEKSIIVKSTDGKIEHNVENTDQLLGVIPDIFGGKTGYTDNALGCMILVVDIPDKNDKLISIVLGSRSRFDDTKKLIDWAKEAYRWE